MAILRNDTTVRSADGQTTSPIITAANIGNYGISTTSTYYIGTTQNVFNRASGAQTLTGVSIDGNAATVTNGVYTTGAQTIGGTKTFSDGVVVNGATYYTFNKPTTTNYQTVALFGSASAGLFLTTDSAIIGTGAYYNAGWIATATSGRHIDFAGGTFNFNVFSGATVGGTANWGSVATLNSSGTFSATGDFRAPIFYDTNNTAYYCDPASVSNLNAVTLNRSGSDGYLTLPGSVTVSNVSGAEMVIRGLSQLRFSNSTSWDWNSWAGLRYDNAGTTIYLGGPAATGIFTQNATPPTVTVSFVGTNNVTSDSNFKGPIFYDSANTAYYLDPANTGTSLLVAGNVGIGTTSPGYILDVRGDIRIGNGTSGEQDIRFVSLNGDWQVGTNNGGNGTNNNQFYFYDNAYRLTIQTGTGNVGIGTTSPSYILDANSTNDNAIRIRNGAGSANNGLALSVGSGSPWLDIIEGVEFRIKGNTYANIGTWNSGNNTKLLINSSGNVGIGTTSPSQKLHVVGTGFASTDFRAPIFYDSDNTVYYIDPASTSNINVLTVNGNTSLQKFTIGNRNLIYSYYHGGAQDLAWKKVADVLLPNSLYSAASFKVNVVDAQGNFGWSTDCRDLTYFISCRRSGGVLNDYDDAILSGPINDYIRIVKTSQGVYELQIRQIQDWQNLYFQFELISGGAGYVTYVSGTPANGSTTGTIYTVNTANANGYTQYYPVVSASASMRSPIFYDSNDTNYYVDAASTSKLSIVSTSRINALDGTFLFKSGSGSGTTRHINLADSTADPSSVGSATGITVGERSDNTAYYMIYVKAPYNNGSSTHSRLVLGWHTGMEIGANATYGGVRFMTDSPGVSTSEIFSVGKTDANVRVANTIFAQTFSDSNNTSYYLDPASTSVLNALTVGGNNVLTTASTLTAGNLSGTIPSGVLGNSTLYVGTTAIALNRGSASQTLTGISIDGNAATASNATQFGGEANTNFMRGLAGGTEANINNYTDNGFRTVAYTGHGKGLLSFNVGSSIGTVQHEYFYNIPTNGWRVRNKTDNTTWSSWGNIVMTDTNQGALTGTVITTGNSSGLSPTFSNLYAAIFYDAADSTYYLDPANTTLSLKTRSSIVINNASAPQNLAMLNIGYNGAGETRAIDIYGSWSGGENKSITFNHASTTSDIVAQINAQHNGPGSRLRWGKLYHGGNSSTYTMELISESITSAYLTVAGSVRAPIFYDSNDTNYYVDPASTSLLNATRSVSIVAGSNSAMTGSPGSLAVYSASSPYISFHDGGVARTAYLQEAGGRFYFGDVPYTESEGSFRAPSFYDVNDTTYYLDPASTSVMLYVRAANFHDSTGSYNVNLGSGNSEGRGLVAGYSGGSYGGIGYNVRHTTTGGSWIAPSTDTSTYLLFSNGVYFYYAAGGAAGRTLSYSTIGSLTSAGIFTVSGDVRAPVFYDSNDTSYYVDPASTSRVNTLYVANSITDSSTVNGRILLYGNLHIDAYNGYDIYCNYYSGRRFRTFKGVGTGAEIFRTDTDGIVYAYEQLRTPILYDHNNTTYYLDPADVSYLYEPRMAYRTLIGAQSYDATLFETPVTTRPGIVVRGSYPHIEMVAAGIDNVNHGATLRFVGYDTGGATTGNFKHWVIGCPATNLTGLYFGYSPNQTNPHYGIGRGWSSGNDVSIFWILNDREVYAENGVRATIFYDRNNTAYYTDPASTSVLYSIAAGVAGNSSANIPALKVTSSGTATTQAAIAIQQQASEGDTIIFCDFDQYVEWNLIHENANNQLIIHGGTSTSNLGSNTFYSPNGTAKTGYIKHVFDMTDGNAYIGGSVGIGTNGPGQKLDVRGTIISNSDVRAPLFYDSDNTGYYLNPAGSSQLSAVYANDWFRAQGNTGLYFQDKGYGITSAGAASNSYGNASTYGSGLNGWQGWGIGSRHCMMSTGGDNFGIHDNTRSWLYYWDGTYHNFQYGYLQSASSVRGPLFYDSDNTAYYCDPASTSNLNAITAAGNITAAQYYTGGWFRNNSSGNGLYNESTTQHFYSDDVSYWNVASSSSAQGIRFRTGGHGGTVRGYVYANNGNDVGFLNNGGNWRARIVGGDYFLADGSSIRGQIFYDSNDTNYYCDPNSSSVLASVTANAYYPRAAVTESDIYAQSLSINAYHHGDSLTYDTFQFNAASTYETRATVGASFVSGTVETSIFKGDRFGGMSIANGVYQVRWTWNNTIGYKFFKTLYLGNSTNGNSFTVTIEASGNGSTWTTIATSTAMSNWPGHSWYNYAWNNNAYQGYIRLTITPSWSTVYGIDIYSMRYFCSYSLDAGSRLYDWDYSKNVTFAAAVSSPIFYDSNNTGYYVNPASQSKLNNLLIDTGSSNTSMTIVGSNQPSIFLKTTDNERNIEIFNSYGNFGIYRINAPSNYIIYHVDNGASSYTYFQLEGTARLTINSSGSTATTSVRSPIFYDSDNTAYFIDGAGTSNILGLTVNNTITGSVSGNAGTATTLQTARNINGTSFNGSANITTASWGTARTITIGATGKSVDGSANASWSLAEITGSQTANTFLAAPNGSAGNPTFRAIVAADIPTLNQNTTGTAANVTGTVAIANGGTGATTAANAATNLGLGTGNTPKFLNVFGERASVTASASTTVNTQFNVTELTMSASITTLTLSNIQANTIVHMWTIVTLGNGTGYSITWPAAIKWPGGTAPTITSTNAKRDIYQFVTYDGGTNIYAIIVGQNL